MHSRRLQRSQSFQKRFRYDHYRVRTKIERTSLAIIEDMALPHQAAQGLSGECDENEKGNTDHVYERYFVERLSVTGQGKRPINQQQI